MTSEDGVRRLQAVSSGSSWLCWSRATVASSLAGRKTRCQKQGFLPLFPQDAPCLRAWGCPLEGMCRAKYCSQDSDETLYLFKCTTWKNEKEKKTIYKLPARGHHWQRVAASNPSWQANGCASCRSCSPKVGQQWERKTPSILSFRALNQFTSGKVSVGLYKSQLIKLLYLLMIAVASWNGYRD